MSLLASRTKHPTYFLCGLLLALASFQAQGQATLNWAQHSYTLTGSVRNKFSSGSQLYVRLGSWLQESSKWTAFGYNYAYSSNPERLQPNPNFYLSTLGYEHRLSEASAISLEGDLPNITPLQRYFRYTMRYMHLGGIGGLKVYKELGLTYSRGKVTENEDRFMTNFDATLSFIKNWQAMPLATSVTLHLGRTLTESGDPLPPEHPRPIIDRYSFRLDANYALNPTWIIGANMGIPTELLLVQEGSNNRYRYLLIPRPVYGLSVCYVLNGNVGSPILQRYTY